MGWNYWISTIGLGSLDSNRIGIIGFELLDSNYSVGINGLELFGWNHWVNYWVGMIGLELLVWIYWSRTIILESLDWSYWVAITGLELLLWVYWVGYARL